VIATLTSRACRRTRRESSCHRYGSASRPGAPAADPGAGRFRTGDGRIGGARCQKGRTPVARFGAGGGRGPSRRCRGPERNVILQSQNVVRGERVDEAPNRACRRGGATDVDLVGAGHPPTSAATVHAPPSEAYELGRGRRWVTARDCRRGVRTFRGSVGERCGRRAPRCDGCRRSRGPW